MILLSVASSAGSGLYYFGVMLVVLACIMNGKGIGCLFRIGMIVIGLLLLACC